jgi:hypothetical protein
MPSSFYPNPNAPATPSIGAAPMSSDLANVPNLPGSGASNYAGSLDYILALTGNGNYVDPYVPRSTLNKTSRKNSQQQAMIAGAGSILPLVYGRRRVGGRIAGVQVTGGLLYLLVVWCYGTTAGVSAIESVEVSNTITTSNVTNYLGNQVAPDPTLVNAKRLEHLVYADVLPGICYSVVGIASSKTSGFPTLNATVRGFKVASVNGGAKAYSTVPAYCIADFITNADYGLGGLVNWTDVAALAARNNQLVGGAVRNQLDVMLDTPQTKRTWLAVLCDYAGCFPFKEGNTWRLVLDAPSTSVVSLGPDRIVGGTLKLSKKDIGNLPTVVQVTYTDTSKTPWTDAQATAYAPGVLDGTTTRRVTQIAKPGITRYAEAYRYAVERLNEALVSDLSCTFSMFDDGLSMEIGDVFDLTHPIGLSAKLFRCLKLDPAQPGRWSVSGLEYDDAKYSNDVASGPSSMDSTLPSPLIVPNVVGLNAVEDVYQIQTGRYASRFIITWDGPTTADYASGGIAYFGYVLLDGYDVLITQGTKQSSYSVPHDQLKFVTDALPENLPYTLQVRARSALVEGAWSTFNITNSGKLSIPSDVPIITGYSTNGETRLTWGAATDLDLTGYEIRYGLTTDTWASAQFTAFVAFPGNTLNTTLIPSGLHRIFIKALDSVRSATFPQGQPSANAAYCDITVTPNTTSSYTNFDPGAPILTLMSAQSGGWMTDTASVWNTLFPLAMTNYPNALATYHAAGISGLVSQTLDLGGIINATVISNLQYLNLSGVAQPYIEYKVNVGDAWTRVNAQVAVSSMRYVRVGITAVLNTDTIFVSTLGVISVGVDGTQNFIQYSIFNDISAWVGAN